MKASLGGIVNLFLLCVFIIVLGSFLLFNVNYSKAYRVKNRIITAYEQFEGNCMDPNNQCYKEISDYENRLGYGKKNIQPIGNSEEECVVEQGYCYTKQCKSVSSFKGENVKSCVYEIRTEVDMDFPLIKQIMGIVNFKIHGKTKAVIVEE